MTQTVYRQIKEFDGNKYTTIIDITNGMTLFNDDIDLISISYDTGVLSSVQFRAIIFANRGNSILW